MKQITIDGYNFSELSEKVQDTIIYEYPPIEPEYIEDYIFEELNKRINIYEPILWIVNSSIRFNGDIQQDYVVKLYDENEAIKLVLNKTKEELQNFIEEHSVLFWIENDNQYGSDLRVVFDYEQVFDEDHNISYEENLKVEYVVGILKGLLSIEVDSIQSQLVACYKKFYSDNCSYEAIYKFLNEDVINWYDITGRLIQTDI